MLRKIIAGAISIALLANPSMIVSSADDSNAETVVNESTTAVEETSTEETDATETSSPKDVGREIRLGFECSVMDIIKFDRMVRLYDSDGNVYYPESGSPIWIIGIDDENQRFRVQSPRVTPDGEFVTYLKYADVPKAVLISHDGYVMGDLCYDGVVNVFDLCLMKRALLYGLEDQDPMNKILADMNYDGELSIADAVWLQKWLLGEIK